MHQRDLVALVLLIAAGAAAPGCAGAPPPAVPQPELAGVEATAEAVPDWIFEVDPSPRERWAAPFAVSAVGRVEPVDAREVVVVGSDPAIAAGLAEQRAAAARVNAAAGAGSADRGSAAGAASRPANGGSTAPAAGGATVPSGADEEASPGGPGAAAPRGAAPAAASAAAPPPASAPAPAAAPARVPAAAASPARSHLVQRGDTWNAIAIRYGVTARALAEANPGVNPERIQIGQTLRIPPGGAAAAPNRSHRVASGETLTGLARRYSVTVESIRRLNGLQDDRLRIGQTLAIPPAAD